MKQQAVAAAGEEGGGRGGQEKEATHAEISCPNELNVERHERVARTREKDCLAAAAAAAERRC